MIAVAAAAAITGCGKKGPPLAPIVRVPAAVQRLEARRVGNEIFITVTIPTQNIDQTTPAAVERIDIYARTGLEPPGARLMADATLVASIPVAEVPLDDTGKPLPPMPRPGEALQGTSVTVRDVLTAEARTPRPLPPIAGRRAAVLPPLPTAAAPAGPPYRYYTAIGFGPRGRSGPGGVVIGVPLSPLPDPPTGLTAEYPPQLIRLAWEPAGGLIGFLLDRELAPEVPPVDVPFVARVESFSAPAPPPAALPATATRPTPNDRIAPSIGGVAPAATAAAGAVAPASGSALAPTSAGAIAPTSGSPLAPLTDLPPGPTRYNVYREMAPDPLELPQGRARGEWEAELPVPLNAVPLDVLTFEDPIQVDGRERCYSVRSVRGAAPQSIESEPTARVCHVPLDTEGPATPTNLTAEASEGAITLLWDPNVDEDLAGYLILRGAPGDATLDPLPGPLVPTARYVDRSVTPGTRYVYVVIAVDDRVPIGNRSDASNRVEETAR